jgi:hypothetical protein
MLEILVAIVGVLIALVGVIVAIFSYRRSMLDAIRQWTERDGREDVVDSRRFIQYELKKGYDPQEIRQNIDNAATKIAPAINAYHHLGTLVKRHYIPVSYFRKNSTGQTIINVYEKLKPYIELVRANNNPYYASGFDFLYKKVKKLRCYR